MKNLKRTTVSVFVGGLLSLGAGSFATAQTDDPTRLEIANLAEELELSDEKSRDLAPLLETLNDVFERREAHFQEGEEIREDLTTAYDQIAETLSASELRDFHWMLRETAVGPRFGLRNGGYMMGGRGFMRGGGRGDFRRGMPMRGGRGFTGRGACPGWRFDDIDPNS